MPMDNMSNTQAEMDQSFFTGSSSDNGSRSYYNNDNMMPGISQQNGQMNNSQQPSLTPDESPQMVGMPQTAEEAYLGSLQAALRNNLGYFVVIEFLIGTNGLTEKEGILYSVGNNFVTLYEQETDRYIVCDLFSVKFVTFFRQTPNVNRGNRLGYENSSDSFGGMVPRRY